MDLNNVVLEQWALWSTWQSNVLFGRCLKTSSKDRSDVFDAYPMLTTPTNGEGESQEVEDEHVDYHYGAPLFMVLDKLTLKLRPETPQ